MSAEQNGANTVSEAVAAATAYLKQLYPSAQEILVEEVERSAGDAYWLITLGMNLEDRSSVAFQALAPAGFRRMRRVYKAFKIARDTGEVVSMKIREPVDA